MVYAYAQRPIGGEPDAVFRAARRIGSDLGVVTGLRRRTRGMLHEELLPLEGERLDGRLWAWEVRRGVSNVYLGLDDRAPSTLVPGARQARRRRRMREAAEWLDRLEREVGGDPKRPRSEGLPRAA